MVCQHGPRSGPQIRCVPEPRPETKSTTQWKFQPFVKPSRFVREALTSASTICSHLSSTSVPRLRQNSAHVGQSNAPPPQFAVASQQSTANNTSSKLQATELANKSKVALPQIHPEGLGQPFKAQVTTRVTAAIQLAHKHWQPLCAPAPSGVGLLTPKNFNDHRIQTKGGIQVNPNRDVFI